jgi:hypothetical protein
MPASSYAARPIDCLNVCSPSAPASVDRNGMSITVWGNVGVTVEIAAILTSEVMPCRVA